MATSCGIVLALWGRSTWPGLWISLTDVRDDTLREQLASRKASSKHKDPQLVHFFGGGTYDWCEMTGLEQILGSRSTRTDWSTFLGLNSTICLREKQKKSVCLPIFQPQSGGRGEIWRYFKMSKTLLFYITNFIGAALTARAS